MRKVDEMNTIVIKHNPSEERLIELGVFDWPVWEKERSEFPWQYDTEETCYLLEGEVVVTPDGGEPVEFGAGDLVTFPRGMSCNWKINTAVRKHYRFA
jgi:uncharacterized cupin superfamily protein